MLGNKIRNLRLKHNMTQNQLGHTLCVSASTIGMYEQGRRYPLIPTLIKIAQCFNVSFDYLLSEDEPCSTLKDAMDSIEYKLSGKNAPIVNGQRLSQEDLQALLEDMRMYGEYQLEKKVQKT